ncbi:MAG: heme exporter protein CcmD [Burkholderiales bacterium]
MTWSSANDFLAMGGYGVYVWGSYGVTLFVIACEILAVRARRRAAVAKLTGMYHAERGQL